MAGNHAHSNGNRSRLNKWAYTKSRDPRLPPSAHDNPHHANRATMGSFAPSQTSPTARYHSPSDTYTSPRKHHHHWLYIWIPLLTSFIWFGTILSMLITWLATGRQHYVSMSPNQKIAFISDVGADILKPLFITAGAITGVGFVMSLAVERWLRHEGRLVSHRRRRERWMSGLAIFGAFIGGVGLILLSIFDTKRHPKDHRGFLLMFIVGVVFSALFTIAEFRWLNKDFNKTYRKLRHAYALKAIIASLLIVLAIAFGSLLDRKQDAAAILEWSIAFGFTLYLLTFAYDFWGSRGRARGAAPVNGLGGAGEMDREKLVGGGFRFGRRRGRV